MRQRPHVLHNVVLRAEHPPDPVAGVVGSEFHRHRPFQHSAHPLAHGPGRARLHVPNGSEDLDTEELARLGRALDARESQWSQAVAAIRLLTLTGCRRSEVLNLRWRDIGAEAIHLSDSKTGPRAVPVGEAARALIETLPAEWSPDAFLFPRYAEGRGQDALRFRWRTVCADAKLGRLRLHDLRHTAASQAVMSGENLPLVGRLLGHRRHSTTAGYAHLADRHLVEVAEKVGSIIAEAMTENRLRLLTSDWL